MVKNKKKKKNIKTKKQIPADKKLLDEIIRVDGKNVSGIVAKNGWDPISETLKVFSVVFFHEPLLSSVVRSVKICPGGTTEDKGFSC